MNYSLRYIKIGMLASVALFLSLVAFNNVVDFNSNWLFVHHVLSMDTTFHETALMGRAITDSNLQKLAYYFIIIWQVIAATLCWIGCFILVSKIKNKDFDSYKQTAFIGLFLGFLLYMVGFLVIGGEWFAMWQSPNWNGQMKAGLFLNFIMFMMIFLNTADDSR
ncbi:transmembrane protein [Legionella quinlivanii]|uniref:Transmembrane protein n=1 Tax=Legionella quinlivanii TaxID=45073 RepID=A0A0W0Y4J7_9GAMM|nr:transmembrane protein [Legionella quinlivanii]SEF83274.1 Predicted small integral membrane protein [Legionella quinlivanii DSM 21216]STY09674.1 transmembrane protein [Legionella quinlivanii]